MPSNPPTAYSSRFSTATPTPMRRVSIGATNCHSSRSGSYLGGGGTRTQHCCHPQNPKSSPQGGLRDPQTVPTPGIWDGPAPLWAVCRPLETLESPPVLGTPPDPTAAIPREAVGSAPGRSPHPPLPPLTMAVYSRVPPLRMPKSQRWAPKSPHSDRKSQRFDGKSQRLAPNRGVLIEIGAV